MGGHEIDGQVAPGFKFEDLDVSDRRVDVEDPVGAYEPAGGSPGNSAAADVPTPVDKYRDGQDLPGLELDMVDGSPTDAGSLVFAAPASDSLGVGGGQVEPVFAALVSLMLRRGVNGGGCSGTHTDMSDEVDQSQSYDGVSMRDLMKLMNQAEAEEAKEIDREILSLVRSLGGDSVKYGRERSRAVRTAVSEICSPLRVSAVPKLCPSFGLLPVHLTSQRTTVTAGTGTLTRRRCAVMNGLK